MRAYGKNRADYAKRWIRGRECWCCVPRGARRKTKQYRHRARAQGRNVEE